MADREEKKKAVRGTKTVKGKKEGLKYGQMGETFTTDETSKNKGKQ